MATRMTVRGGAIRGMGRRQAILSAVRKRGGRGGGGKNG